MKTPFRWLVGFLLALTLGIGPAGAPGLAVAHDHDHEAGHDHAGGLPEDHPDCSLCLAVHHLAVDLPTAPSAPVRVDSPGLAVPAAQDLPSRNETRDHRNRGPPTSS